jgi:hypothetical protein
VNKVDEIEFVIRFDGLSNGRKHIHAKSYVIQQSPSDFARGFDLAGATRYVFAGAAADAIRARQEDWKDGGRYSIVPVKVVRVPAVTEVVEVSPAKTTVELF